MIRKINIYLLNMIIIYGIFLMIKNIEASNLISNSKAEVNNFIGRSKIIDQLKQIKKKIFLYMESLE